MHNAKSPAFLKIFFWITWLKFKLAAPAAPGSFPAGLPGTRAVPSISRGFVSNRAGSLWRGKFGLSPGTPLFAGLSNRAWLGSASRDFSQAASVCGGLLQWASSDQRSSRGCSHWPHCIASPRETLLRPSSWKSSSLVFCSSALLAGLDAHLGG